jgi:two-component system probable response regulator PhcQ
METMYDYKRYAILYVDDEDKSLKYFSLAFADRFRILTAPDAAAGYALLQQHKDEIAVLMTDQRMPGEKGVQFLERARQLNPHIIRILATAYSDLEAAIQAVNAGSIYRYITKPWDLAELEITLRRALEFFLVQHERDHLLREKVAVLHKAMLSDRVINLGVVAAGLGHYVKNSLVTVRTFLDLAPSKLQEEGLDLQHLHNPAFWKDFYAQMRVQVERITDMLHLLGQATERPAEGFGDPVQLAAVAAQALAQAQPRLEEKQLQIDNQIPVDLPSILVDRLVFDRLFEFLLEDQLTVLPAGGALTLRGRSTTLPPDGSAAVELELEDNGPGLPAAALRSVFDPFFLRDGKPQEFGINLMACYFIVYHHGGLLEIDNRASQGVRIKITLPVQPRPLAPATLEQNLMSKVLVNDQLWEQVVATP